MRMPSWTWRRWGCRPRTPIASPESQKRLRDLGVVWMGRMIDRIAQFRITVETFLARLDDGDVECRRVLEAEVNSKPPPVCY
jgi:hypothetical protein